MIRAVYISVILAFALDAAAQFEFDDIATLDAKITESSGLVASRRYPGILWTHSDGGYQFLFAINTNGHRIGAFGVPGNLIDWEDIAIDPAGGIYLADTGSNGLVRTHVAVHRVAEPNPYKRFGNTKINRSWYLRFPEGKQQDCEALFVHNGFGYLIQKRTPTGEVSMYRFRLADRRRSIPLQRVARLPIGSPVTAADLSLDSKRLALTTSDGIFLYILNGGPPSAASVTPIFFPFADDSMEGGTFFGEGFLTTNERGTLWAFKDANFVCRGPARLEEPLPNHIEPVGTPIHYEAKAIGCPPPQFAWFFNGQPIPGATNASLDLPGISSGNAGAYTVAVFNRFGGETNTSFLNVLVSVDIRITEVMSSPATNATVETADWWELTNFEAQPMDLSGWRFNDSVGGLTDPFVFPDGFVLDIGETVILVENLTPDEFRAWWGAGANNIPSNVRIFTYSGPGLSFRATGDTIYLWNNITTDPEDYVTRADFGEATPGVTFIYNPFTNLFGEKSQIDVLGAVKAERGSDIGSPGRLVGDFGF
jgi:hypothetical protein